MNNVDKQYFNLLRKILKDGNRKVTRAGETLSLFGENMRFKLNDGFPLLTTKKMFTKGIIYEVLWFIHSDTNIKYLIDNGVHIWDDDAYRWYCSIIDKNNEIIDKYGIQTFVHDNSIEYSYTKLEKINKETFLSRCDDETKFRYVRYDKDLVVSYSIYKYGDLGDIYGKSFRRFGINNIDQIKNIINTLESNPDDRRMLCINYNPDVLDNIVLAPCHIMFQFYTKELKIKDRWELYYNKFKDEEINHDNFARPHLDVYGMSGEFQYNGEYDYLLDEEDIPTRELSCSFYCRSQDVPLGTPFNIASYALLTHLIAQVCNMSVGDLVYNGGDCHIYTNQIEGVNEQLNRNCEEYDSPELWINPTIKNIDDFTIDDIKIMNYKSYPTINIPLSVG